MSTTVEMERRSPEQVSGQREAFVERMLKSTAGVFDIYMVYLGDRLGFYEALSEAGWLTASDLAAQTGTHERYVREWLEQQAVTGILEVDDELAESQRRRFRLPPGHAEVLTNRDSLDYLAPLAQIVVGAVTPLPAILEAFRTGGGVPFAVYGADVREGQAGMNRAMFLRLLGSEWLPAVADVHARLQADPPARVADIGCGAGWSSIGIAQAYPKVVVDGFDLDEPSIELARRNARSAGLEDRVCFQVRDAGDPDLSGCYDLVAAFECIHDMSDPVGALRAMRSLAGDRGAVIVMDERAGETFATSGNDLDWFYYGFSVLHCLPVGMAEQPSTCTGTVMRPETLRRYGLEAGFRDVEVLPIENYFFRFYRLVT